jgi:hypothetical protein
MCVGSCLQGGEVIDTEILRDVVDHPRMNPEKSPGADSAAAKKPDIVIAHPAHGEHNQDAGDLSGLIGAEVLLPPALASHNGHQCD